MKRVSGTVVLLLLVCSSEARADDCSLRGTVKTPDGAPASNIRVMIMGQARSRASNMQTTSRQDGSFDFEKLPCGKYQVLFEGGLQPVELTGASQITLTISRNSIRASEMTRELSAAREAAAGRALTADEARDEDVADRFRDDAVRRLAPAADYAAYQRKSTREEKTLAFQMVVAKRLAETEARGVTKLNLARAFMTTKSPAADAQAFAAGSRREQAQMLLAVCLGQLRRTAWPTTVTVYLVDSSYGVAAKAMVQAALGTTSREFLEWDATFSPRWRGEAVHVAMLRAIEILSSAAAGKVDPDNAFFKEFSQDVASLDEGRAIRLVTTTYGAAVVDEYRRADDRTKRELLMDAKLLEVALGWATLLEL